MQLFLVRPVGKHTVNKNDFRWGVVVSSDPTSAALVAVKWRKEGGFEPRPVYEVVPAKGTEQHITQFGSHGGKPVGSDESINALWDWDKRVEVRV